MILPDQTVNTDVFSDLDFSIFDADWVADNFEMHTHFEVHDAVAKLDREKLLKLLEFRVNFLQEELNEAKAGLTTLQGLQTAAGDVTAAGAVAAEDVVDAMIDLCVVAIGTLDLFQVDAYEAWDRVHAANMAKQVGIKPGRPNPLGLPDLIKPAGWVGPRHDDNLGILPRLYGVQVDTE